MKKFIAFLLIFCAATLSPAQYANQPKFRGYLASNPSSCSRTGERYWNTSSLQEIYCTAVGTPGTWAAPGGGGAASPLTLTAANASQVPLTIKMAVSQTANPFEIQPNGSTTPFFKVDANGFLYVGDSSVSPGRQVIIQQWSGQNAGAIYSGAITPSAVNYALGFSQSGTYVNAPTTGVVDLRINNVPMGQFDENATAGNTRFLLYDVTAGTLKRVSVGANDSGGTGFKVLRVPN